MSKTSNFNKFFILWLGEMISSIGSGISAFGLGVFVFSLTQTATSVSLIMLFSFVPSIILSPFAGVLADRYDRRLLMIIGDFFSALFLVIIIVLISFSTIQLWQICLLVGLSSIFVSLIDPSYRATVTDLLTEEEYVRAGGMLQLASSAKFLLSPLIAGFLLTITNISTLILIDILTIVVTIITISYVKSSTEIKRIVLKNENLWQSFYEGFNVVKEKPGILNLILLLSVITFFIGFLETLFTPFLLPLSTPSALGIIQSVSAIGMLISSLIIGIINLNKHQFKSMTIALFLSGLFIIGLGAVEHLIVIAIFGFLFFSTLPFINTAADVLIRRNIPDEKQGRVWGLVSILSQLGYIFAYAISGPLSDFVFNPLLTEHGLLANSLLGQIIGTGPTRGIGLLFIVIGIGIIFVSIKLYHSKKVRYLERMIRSSQ